MFDDELDGFFDLDECARRMELTKAEVMELVSARVLRAQHLGFGEVWVQPAIVSR